MSVGCISRSEVFTGLKSMSPTTGSIVVAGTTLSKANRAVLIEAPPMVVPVDILER